MVPGGFTSPDKCKIYPEPVTLLIEPVTGKVRMDMKKSAPKNKKTEEKPVEEPEVIEEIVVEELSIDGVCGVY